MRETNYKILHNHNPLVDDVLNPIIVKFENGKYGVKVKRFGQIVFAYIHDEKLIDMKFINYKEKDVEWKNGKFTSKCEMSLEEAKELKSKIIEKENRENDLGVEICTEATSEND